MPEVIYDGPFPGVEFTDSATGRQHTAEKGKPVEVSKELAASLCEQSDIWRLAGKKKSTAAEAAEKKE